MLMPSLYLSILVDANVDVNAVVVDVNGVADSALTKSLSMVPT